MVTDAELDAILLKLKLLLRVGPTLTQLANVFHDGTVNSSSCEIQAFRPQRIDGTDSYVRKCHHAKN